MPPRYGTLSVLDTLATYNTQSVLTFGEEKMAGYLQQILDAYEALVGDILGDFVGMPVDRETTYGVNTTSGEMVDVDEYGLTDAQKIPFAPSSVGFPLRRSQYAIQWTRDYLATTTPRELAVQTLAVTEADQRAIYRKLRQALLRATNTTTYIDRLVDNKTFSVRALANADGQAIPPHPITAASFDAATHTHYLASATFVEANLVSLVETVRQHGLGGGSIRVYINAAQEAAVRGFADFNPYVDPRLAQATTADRAVQSIDYVNLEDRAIGFHGVAEIWVKPWAVANYLVASIVGGGPADPVLGWRKPVGAMAPFGELRIVAELDRHPLHARTFERQMGLGVWNRTRAAVLYIGGGTYANYVGN